MRTWICLALLTSTAASADDSDTTIHAPLPDEQLPGAWLHLDVTKLDPTSAAGGIVERRSALLTLGPRVRLAAEGKWWQTGLAPSMFATDLSDHGWRAGAELSYDLGPFRVGLDASMTRTVDGSHRMVGLFAYRTFRLSRWMHAWIVLGIAFEKWQGLGVADSRQGMTVGLALGTTFR